MKKILLIFRKISVRLPQILQPQPAHHAFVLGLDNDGRVVHNLQFKDPSALSPVTSTYQHDGYLYLGSLLEHRFARYKL